MEWLRKNGALAIGIGLPLLLVAVFALAAWLPKLFVPPPKYDVLYLTHYYPNNPGGLRFTVHDRHIAFTVSGSIYGYNNAPKLYRYSPANGAIKEIPLPLPENMPARTYNQPQLPQEAAVTPLPVPEAEALSLDTSAIAPDGYEFRSGYGNSPELAGALFFSPNYRNFAVLVKDGRVIPIAGNDAYYNYANITFIGWVIP